MTTAQGACAGFLPDGSGRACLSHETVDAELLASSI
jgi:hypothetical protein